MHIRWAIAAVVVMLAVFFAGYDLSQTPSFTTNQPAAASSANAVGVTYTNASENDIFITVPSAGAVITNSIVIEGFARGGWYFEASFPIVVTGRNGMVIATGNGTAIGDWTTSSYVPFTAKVDIKDLYNGPATVTLKNDNPSGDPTKDKRLSFPVMVQ